LRQAYDYWQDQPGNYFPIPLSRPSTTRVRQRTRFRDAEFIISFTYQGPIRSPRVLSSPVRVQDLLEPAKWNHLISHSHMSQVRSPCPVNGTKGHPPSMGTTNDRRHLKRPTQTRRIPEWLSCIRFDHRQATHHPSMPLKHVAQGQLEASKATRQQQCTLPTHQGRSPFKLGFPHNGTH
jgi:hypothetical protein